MVFRYRDEWQNDPALQGWLLKVSNDASRAYCRYCEIVLRAHRADLSAHANTQKHTTNTQRWLSQNDNQQLLEPVSVEIVARPPENETPDPTASTGDEEYPAETPGGDEEQEAEDEQKVEKKSTGGKRFGEYIKRYRTAWESEDEFKGWLAAYPEDPSKAFCKACKSILRAHKHDISCHARTIRHQKNFEKSPENEETEGHYFEISDLDLSSAAGKSIKLGVVDADGGVTVSVSDDHTHSHDLSGIEILPDDPLSNNGTAIEIKPKIIKLSKSALRTSTPRAPAQRKRPRINASDVIQAIENNEFTGYEILQIVKTAVPKL